MGRAVRFQVCNRKNTPRVVNRIMKKQVWTQSISRFVREWYNDKIKIDPRVLADKLGVQPDWLINKMQEFGIRNKREHKHDN